MQCLQTLSKFRDSVRQLALEKKEPKEYLQLCDMLRDVQLAELGVILDDQKGMPNCLFPLQIICH